MTCILALDTSTDSCSVALYRDGQIISRCSVAPRQHNRLLIPMLEELVPGGKLREQGVEALAYAAGPGSFTGLRIAASAVQGLAFAHDLPVVPVSTLACQAQTALRLGLVDSSQLVLSLLDARINEIYASVVRFRDGLADEFVSPVATAPERLWLPEQALVGRPVPVGSGAALLGRCSAELARSLAPAIDHVAPHAEDLIPLARDSFGRGEFQSSWEVTPVYVRDEINWKKIPEQGRAV